MVTLSQYEVSYYYSIMQVVDNKTKNQTLCESGFMW